MFGKTTSARIIANKLNNGQGAPIELDCASHNSAEDARAIVEECRTRPLAGKYKIFLLDEVHMFSQTAWNVLLKILEEPPEYIIFLFCTTDPQKIIGTIMSRVQRYNLTRISTKGIISRLTYILNKENVTSYEIQAIEYIARLARGGMRDAITSLEKCLDYDNNLTLVNVQKVMSNGLDEDTLFSFMKLMLDNNSKEALNCFYRVYMKGVDTTLFLKLYTTYIENCVKYLILKDEYNVELSELTLNWLKENDTFFEDLRVQLLSLINIKNNYSSEDLRIIIESWIIQSCIS